MKLAEHPAPPVTLVLLPGMDGTGDLFWPLVRELPGRFAVRIVRYPVDRAAGYEELTAFARTMLPSNSPFVLLGESFSGPVAIRLAAESPPNLRGVVLCCTFARNPRPWLAWLRGLSRWLPIRAVPTRWLAVFLLGRWSSAEWRAVLARTLAQVSPAAMRARVHAVLSVDASADLVRVQVPMLYLRARQDRVVPASAAREVRRLKPDTQFIELCGPHCLLQVAPTAATPAIQSFVDGLNLAPSLGMGPSTGSGRTFGTSPIDRRHR